MSSERTLVLVKPDGVCKHVVGAVIDRFEKGGLRLAGLRMVKLSGADAERFYQEHKGKPFFDPLISFMTSAPIVAIVWQGDDAIKKARSLMGATDSQKADLGTLRRDFGTDNRKNLVHGSDSPASAAREIDFFFKPEQLFTYGEEDFHGEPKKASHSVTTR